MRVAVGSGNPVKLRAVEQALPTAEVVSVSVASGVGEQPYGLAETVRGAETRSTRALDGHDLGVGIEGGVARLPDLSGLWLVMWAAATDGEKFGRGGGPSFRLPDRIATRIDAGEELGPVMDDLLSETDVARNQGAAGVLTAGTIDREGALRDAVAGALGPFVTEYY